MKGHKFHKREIEGKIKECEEIRGISNKNGIEHQFGAFGQFIFGIGFREEKRTKRINKAIK